MRNRPTSRNRFSALLSLFLHLALVGAGPVVDARLEADAHDSVHAGVHVEDAGAPECASGHAHDSCTVCRALRGLDAPERGVPPFATAHPASHAQPSAHAPTVLSPAISSLGPRAPPAA